MMEIKMRPIRKLKPYRKNAKKHTLMVWFMHL
jgi:hypothetical protein